MIIYADLPVVIFVASIFIAWTRWAGSTNGSTQLAQVAERSTAVYPFHLENAHQDSWERVQGAQKHSLSFTTVFCLALTMFVFDCMILLHQKIQKECWKSQAKERYNPRKPSLRQTFLATSLAGGCAPGEACINVFTRSKGTTTIDPAT